MRPESAKVPKRVKVYVVPEALGTAMARGNISQNGLARAMHVSSGYMSQLCRGTRSPSPRLRQRLQEFLKVDDFDAIFRLERQGRPRRRRS